MTQFEDSMDIMDSMDDVMAEKAVELSKARLTFSEIAELDITPMFNFNARYELENREDKY